MTDKKERWLLVVWLGINLAIGLWIVRDYGLSFDESNYYRYANYTLEAYKSFFGRLYEPDYAPSHLQYYGPAFILIVNTIVKILHWLPFEVFEFDVWHYSYFVTFQLTGLCLFGLARRWFSRWTAWAVLVLFITQPVLWGHAFINPKDIPFMFFFTFSIWIGFWLVDSMGGETASFSMQVYLNRFLKRWQPIDPHKKRAFLFWLVFIVAGLAASRRLVSFAIDRTIRFFYNAAPDSWGSKLVAHFAENISSVPVEDYVIKLQALYVRFDFVLFALGLMIIGGYLIALLTNTSWIVPGKRRWHRLFELFRLQKLSYFFRQILKSLVTPKVVLAGAVLGLTISVRILGPLAGMIVILFLWIRNRQKSYPIMIAYWIWAGVSMYLTWPFLWLAPVTNFYESLVMMSNFPWQGRVLFNGAYYASSEIPASYIPILLNIQLTEIFIFLWYLGFGLFIWHLFRKEIKVDLLLYIGLGFLLPVGGLIMIRSPLYDNFRQLLFLLPAMFLIVAFVLQPVFKKIQHNWLRFALILVFVFPGLKSIQYLHPYEYIYYNAFAGGVEGAACCFELDYWRTSMRELALKVNEIAEPGERVVFKGASVMIGDQYFRPDLIAEKYQDATFDLNGEYDYALLHPRYEESEYYYPDAEVIFTVERDGVILGVVKKVTDKKWH